MPRSALSVPLLAAVCVALGTLIAAAADTPVPVRAQSGMTPLDEAAQKKEVAKVESPAAEEKDELPLAAVPVLNTLGRLPITNSMFVTWIVAAGIIVFARLAMRHAKLVPTGAQNFWEWLVGGLHDFLESIIGPDLVRRGFWFFATIFIFILFVNWVGLFPGVGTVGWGYHDAASGVFHVDRPLLRGGNADLNMTTAMAATFFVLWFVWAFQVNGFVGFFREMFGTKGDMTGFLKIIMVPLFLMVGLLETISVLFRPVALTFRLFGNMYAGETMLESMYRIVPALSWLIPLPFYFLEVLVGFVQALVFMLLTAVFTLLIAPPEGGHEKAH